MKGYFFDTYALMEILLGNPRYLEYNNMSAMITKMNLLELHYHWSIRFSKEDADLVYGIFSDYTIDIDDDTIKEASAFRAKNTKLKLSFIDCLGYVMARRRGVKFLTGDNAFKGLENVEFVK